MSEPTSTSIPPHPAAPIMHQGIVHQLRVPLPYAMASFIHLHLTIHARHLQLFLTTRSPESGMAPALGSFVYALPDHRGGMPLCTSIYVKEDSVETATRVAKVLAKRCAGFGPNKGRGVYVGCSMSFKGTGRGGAPEEEMEAVRKVIEVVVEKVREADEYNDAVEKGLIKMGDELPEKEEVVVGEVGEGIGKLEIKA